MKQDKSSQAKKVLSDFDLFISKYKGKAPKKLKAVWSEVLLMARMLRSWLKGEYKAPWKTISAIIIALAYLVNPMDLIPDFIVGLGLLDDLVVLKKSLHLISQDLKDYSQWEQDSSIKK